MILQMDKLKERIILDDNGKHDETVRINQLHFLDSGDVLVPTVETDKFSRKPFSMTDHALGQISNKLGIPTRYAKKCLEREPSLFAEHANYWLDEWVKEDPDKKLFIRNRGETTRAFLSDRYTILDNNRIVDMLGNVLNGGEILDIKNLSLDDRYLNLRMTIPAMKVNVGTIQKPDNVMIGIHISNSEVGCGSLRVDSCLYRLVCSNGLVVRVGGDSLMAQRHMHINDNAMEEALGKSLLEAVKVGDKAVEQFAVLQDKPISNPMAEISKIAQSQKYSKKFEENIKQNYETERTITGKDTAFEIVNALTRSAQNFDDFDRRLEAEVIAGKVMDKYLK